MWGVGQGHLQPCFFLRDSKYFVNHACYLFGQQSIKAQKNIAKVELQAEAWNPANCVHLGLSCPDVQFCLSAGPADSSLGNHSHTYCKSRGHWDSPQHRHASLPTPALWASWPVTSFQHFLRFLALVYSHTKRHWHQCNSKSWFALWIPWLKVRTRENHYCSVTAAIHPISVHISATTAPHKAHDLRGLTLPICPAPPTFPPCYSEYAAVKNQLWLQWSCIFILCTPSLAGYASPCFSLPSFPPRLVPSKLSWYFAFCMKMREG